MRGRDIIFATFAVGFAGAQCAPAIAEISYLKEAPAPGGLRRGEVVYVDDGKCPKGQVKRVTGGGDIGSGKHGGGGGGRIIECIPRP